MLLAGDLGGTKTLLGLFEVPRRPAGTEAADERPRPVATRVYHTLDFHSLDGLVGAFLDETRATVEAACIGVAGPVTGLVARLTNVPWLADGSALSDHLDGAPVRLLNDLEAMAYAIPVLEPDETAVLQGGIPAPAGNAALIAAGTGLGEAVLHNVHGRFVPMASEGGHADFAARTRRELALVEELSRVFGRVDCERIISGLGLVNLFRFTHGASETAAACRAVGPDVHPSELPAAITTAALARSCEACVETLDMFIEAYGAEAGNLALRSVATAGVYIGGGIAPKILPALESGPFLDAFRNKEPLADLLRTIPVAVILNTQAGLIGASVHAATLIETET